MKIIKEDTHYAEDQNAQRCKEATKRKRNLRKTAVTDMTNVAKVKRMVPYK